MSDTGLRATTRTNNALLSVDHQVWIDLTSPLDLQNYLASRSRLRHLVLVIYLFQIPETAQIDCQGYKRFWKTSAIQQPQKAQLSHLPWRNWLARSTVRLASAWFGYREVDSSSLSGRALLLLLPRLVLDVQSNRLVQSNCVLLRYLVPDDSWKVGWLPGLAVGYAFCSHIWMRYGKFCRTDSILVAAYMTLGSH
jgi:hypothetical protein